MAWWLIASIFVIGCSGGKELCREVRGIQRFVLAAFLVFLVHGIALYNEVSFSFGSAWLMKVALLSASAVLIAERERWEKLFKFLKICLLFQIPVLVLQWFEVWNPWGVSSGTLGKRAGLGILAAYVTVNSSGLTSWISSILAMLSTSMAGMIPAVSHQVWSFRRGRIVLGILTGLSLLVLPSMGVRVATRFEAWSSLSFLRRGWLTGWGFLPFAGSFRDDALRGGALASLRFTDYHSTYLDWIARFGLIGLVVISPFVIWVLSRTLSQLSSWKVWSMFLALFAGAVQSAEGILVMCLLGFLWIIRLNEEVSHVDTLHPA